MDLTSDDAGRRGHRPKTAPMPAWHGAHSRHRHAAAAAVRHRGTEAALSSESRDSGDDRGVLPERAAGRFRRAGRPHARRSDRPTASTTSSTARRCGSPTAATADLYTVFAKVGGEKFTAFLVERAWPGVSTGAEEKKMGIKGSSTTAVYLDNVKVPVENVLGEIGRGHIIAFNILNLGRLKLGPFASGGCREDAARFRSSTRRSARRSASRSPNSA